MNSPASTPASDLHLKADQLRTSRYFVNPSDSAELLDKAMIFLVLAGLKPVSEVASAHWVKTERGRRTVPDDPAEIAAFLERLGLHYQLEATESYTAAIVSLDPALPAAFLAAHDSATVGTLLGYPTTAISAFVEQRCMPSEEQDKLMQRNGISNIFTPFRFSRDHWQEELGVVRAWDATLEKYGLKVESAT